MSILVIDLGTSSVRAAVVAPDATVAHEVARATLPSSPADGLVEFDAAAYLAAAMDCAQGALAAHGGAVEAVGITNQRATTVVWDRATGEPVAPAQGWQDLRTVGDCLVLAAEGFPLAPNQSALKLANILDAVDPQRERDLCFGTPDSWLIWHLTEGAHHVADLSNAGVWGLLASDATHFDAGLLERLRIPASVLPRIVDSSGVLDAATALPGAPPIAGIAGDQQASLVGQGCVTPGAAKITFGTGGMLDVCLGERPSFTRRGAAGCFPIVAWRRGDELVWGAEAVMLSAGTNVEWLVEDLGLIDSPNDVEALAASVESSDGVVYVPALLGLGTPHWDYGARGGLFGVTRGTTGAHVARAVLEGVAQRGADLLDAARADTGVDPEALRIDGGMSTNGLFVQALADATGRVVEVSPVKEATTLGAGLLAGLAVGTWGSWDDVAATWNPSRQVEPAGPADRERWADAVQRAAAWHPELSALDF